MSQLVNLFEQFDKSASAGFVFKLQRTFVAAQHHIGCCGQGSYDIITSYAHQH